MKQVAGKQGKHFAKPAQRDIDATAEEIAALLQQAHDLGVEWAQSRLGNAKTQEGVGDWLKGVGQKASDIVSNFIDSIKSWFSDHAGDEDIESEYEDFVDGLSDGTAQYEVVGTMEGAVFDTFQANDVPQIIWVAENDDAVCETCLNNEEQGPIDIGSEFASGDVFPPAHPRCRCHLSIPD